MRARYSRAVGIYTYNPTSTTTYFSAARKKGVRGPTTLVAKEQSCQACSKTDIRNSVQQ